MKSLVNSFFRKAAIAMFCMVTFLFLSPATTFSQENNCLSKLKKAQELFDSGLIEEIPFMLDSCLRDGFNRDQTIQAFRLLIQVYLFDYNQEKAEKTMLSFLSQFPEYEIQSNDPVEFVNLYNKFQTIPRYSFSIHAGLNMSEISVIEQFSTGNLNNIKSEYKSGGVRPGIRFTFEKYLNSRFWVTTGIGYSYAGYEVSEQMNFGRELLSFNEKMQFVHVPHYLNYAFGNFGRVTPYIFAGGQFSYLLKSNGEINKRSLEVTPTTTDLKGIEKDLTRLRIRESYSILGGAGLRIKVNTGYIRANLFYTRGLTYHVSESTRFSDTENLFFFNFIDDKIKLNFFYFNVGYSYIFYKTSKKPAVENTN
jgi:hypothetical protein